ncbi:MAG: hypothetical protein QOH14_3180 [Pseudonocardiales bacterium]|jgi:hypothetical protein|nr:hypothetical protein [Pseudonocardiales bacterium]
MCEAFALIASTVDNTHHPLRHGAIMLDMP